MVLSGRGPSSRSRASALGSSVRTESSRTRGARARAGRERPLETVGFGVLGEDGELAQAARQLAVALARRPRRRPARRKQQWEERQLQRVRVRGREEPLEVSATERPPPGRRVSREIEERLVSAEA